MPKKLGAKHSYKIHGQQFNSRAYDYSAPYLARCTTINDTFDNKDYRLYVEVEPAENTAGLLHKDLDYC